MSSEQRWSDSANNSASSDYVDTVKIGGTDGVVTNVVKQGGIVSVYYLGCIIGCFAGWVLACRLDD